MAGPTELVDFAESLQAVALSLRTNSTNNAVRC
jgi:hypothetical protein